VERTVFVTSASRERPRKEARSQRDALSLFVLAVGGEAIPISIETFRLTVQRYSCAANIQICAAKSAIDSSPPRQVLR
jgi:hypothetical protein